MPPSYDPTTDAPPLPDFALGNRPSPPDYRDIQATALPEVAAQPAPLTFKPDDVRKFRQNDQQKNGSCVGQMGSKAKEYTARRSGKPVDFSARAAYILSREQDPLPPTWQGSNLRAMLKALDKVGAVPLGTDGLKDDDGLPHEVYADPSFITQAMRDAAAEHKIEGYARFGTDGQLIGIEQIRKAVSSFYPAPAMIAVSLGKEWWKDINGVDTWAAEDIIPVRPPLSGVVGRHALLVDSYETLPDGRLLVEGPNWWSKYWGLRGRFQLIIPDYAPWLHELWVFTDLPPEVKEDVKDLPPASAFRHYWGRNLAYGMENDEDVRAAQVALKIAGTFPVGQRETGGFFDITARAVDGYQAKKGISPRAPRSIGPLTRRALNEQFSPVYRWAMGIQQHEGYLPPSPARPLGSRSWRNNNPGNIKYVRQPGTVGKDAQGFAVFVSYEAGFAELVAMLLRIGRGQSQNPRYKATMSLRQFFEVYAPSEDNNDPLAYAKAVATRIGVPVDTPVSYLV